MKFKVKSKPAVTFEPIAFADIVINLFVFFFITFGLFATFDVNHRGTFPISLPHASNVSGQKSNLPLVLTIDQNGQIYVGPRKIDLAKLREVVHYEISSRKDKTILVRADRSLPLQKFVTVLDLLRKTKARSVSIETQLD